MWCRASMSPDEVRRYFARRVQIRNVEAGTGWKADDGAAGELRDGAGPFDGNVRSQPCRIQPRETHARCDCFQLFHADQANLSQVCKHGPPSERGLARARSSGGGVVHVSNNAGERQHERIDPGGGRPLRHSHVEACHPAYRLTSYRWHPASLAAQRRIAIAFDDASVAAYREQEIAMSLDPQLSSRLLQSVEEGFTDQLAFTQTMMRFPSLRGAEHAVQDFIFRTLRARGYAVERFEMDEAALQRHVGSGAFSEEH